MWTVGRGYWEKQSVVDVSSCLHLMWALLLLKNSRIDLVFDDEYELECCIELVLNLDEEEYRLIIEQLQSNLEMYSLQNKIKGLEQFIYA